MRLIDADAAIEKIERQLKYLVNHDVEAGALGAQNIVKHMPTANANHEIELLLSIDELKSDMCDIIVCILKHARMILNLVNIASDVP